MGRGTDKTAEEREAFFASFIAAMSKLDEARRKLIGRGLRAGKITCPWCGAKGACAVGIAGPRNHLRAHCATYHRSMME